MYPLKIDLTHGSLESGLLARDVLRSVNQTLERIVGYSATFASQPGSIPIGSFFIVPKNKLHRNFEIDARVLLVF